jgi:hypothetical protein
MAYFDEKRWRRRRFARLWDGPVAEANTKSGEPDWLHGAHLHVAYQIREHLNKRQQKQGEYYDSDNQWSMHGKHLISLEPSRRKPGSTYGKTPTF